MRCPRCGFENPEGMKFCGVGYYQGVSCLLGVTLLHASRRARGTAE